MWTLAVRGCEQHLPCAQAVAKQHIAVLRAAKAAQQSAQQPFAAADWQPAAAQPAATAQPAGARRPAAEQPMAAAEEHPVVQQSSTAAAVAQAVSPTAASPTAASSPGAVAARASRQKTAVSATAAWAPAAGVGPAFPPKNPETRRRVQRSTDTVDAQVWHMCLQLERAVAWAPG